MQIVEALLDGRITVTPLLSRKQIGPNTLDVRLGTEFVVRKMDVLTHLNPAGLSVELEQEPEKVASYYERTERLDPRQPFVLHAGQFALGCTLEYVKLPPNIGAFLEGRSTWAREGLNVHTTAALIHPGHDGIIVFELHNVSNMPIELHVGIRVAQLWFYEMSQASARAYTSREGAKYKRFAATAIGRPWEDEEFRLIGKTARG
jgi:dCTP deaminase